MSAKSDYQNKYTQGYNRNFGNVVPVFELAGEVFEAKNAPALTEITGNTTLTAEDSGKIFLVTADATITLPATAAGLKYKFINGGATTTVEIVISPNASDGIFGTTNASTNVVFTGTDDADIKNTKATTQKGDNITLVADGDDGWYVVGCHGVWANV